MPEEVVHQTNPQAFSFTFERAFLASRNRSSNLSISNVPRRHTRASTSVCPLRWHPDAACVGRRRNFPGYAKLLSVCNRAVSHEGEFGGLRCPWRPAGRLHLRQQPKWLLPRLRGNRSGPASADARPGTPTAGVAGNSDAESRQSEGQYDHCVRDWGGTRIVANSREIPRGASTPRTWATGTAATEMPRFFANAFFCQMVQIP
jgi:hypothetical protein